MKSIGGRTPTLTKGTHNMHVVAVGVERGIHHLAYSASPQVCLKTREHMLCLFPVLGNVAEVAIEKHVGAPSGLPGYNTTPEHREFSEKAGLVIICALQEAPN